MVGMPIPLNINQAGYSDIGQVRKENEDYLVSYQGAGHDFAFTIIADGMGGYTGGAVASKLAATVASDHLQASLEFVRADNGVDIFEQLQQHLEQAIQLANKHLLTYKEAHPQLSEMGTTLVVAIIYDKYLLVANVGDSRAYLYSDQRCQQISRDHSVVQELINSGALTAEDARSSDVRNQLTQAVGIAEEITIYFAPIALTKPALLLLCSDGLTEYLDDQSLAAELSKGLPVSQSCHRLIEAANQQGGKDNITVAIVEYGGI